MKKIISFIFVILASFHNTCFADDIPAQNAGEQAMIAGLRAAINNEAAISKSPYKIIIGAGISGAEAFRVQPNLNELHVLLTWQWLDNFHNLADNTIVVVPYHALDERFEILKAKGITSLC